MEENSWMKKFVAVVSAILAMPQVVAAKEAVQASNQDSVSFQHKADIVDATIKGLPPVAVSGAAAAGFHIDSLVFWLTVIYLILQIGFLVYKWKNLHLDRQKKDIE